MLAFAWNALERAVYVVQQLLVLGVFCVIVMSFLKLIGLHVYYIYFYIHIYSFCRILYPKLLTDEGVFNTMSNILLLIRWFEKYQSLQGLMLYRCSFSKNLVSLCHQCGWHSSFWFSSYLWHMNQSFFPSPTFFRPPMSYFWKLVIGFKCQGGGEGAGPKHPGSPKNVTYQGTAVPWWLSKTCPSSPRGTWERREGAILSVTILLWGQGDESLGTLVGTSTGLEILQLSNRHRIQQSFLPLDPEELWDLNLRGEKLRPRLLEGNGGSC